MRPNAQLPAELVTLTEEILNGKLHFCSVLFGEYYCDALDYLITSKEGLINMTLSCILRRRVSYQNLEPVYYSRSSKTF